MNLFSCKFYFYDKNGARQVERKNFDSLYWASITIFQVFLKKKIIVKKIYLIKKNYFFKDINTRRLE